MFEIDHKPPHHPPCPPDKPSYTMQEEHIKVMAEIRETIERFVRFEQRLKCEVEREIKQLNADNCTFKDTFANEHRLFVEEINNTISTFIAGVNANYSNLLPEFEANVNKYIETTTKAYNDFVSSINQRLDAYNDNHAEAFADYQRHLQTEINTFEATVNTNFANFTTSVNNSIEVFRDTWEAIIRERLNQQDAKLSDAEMYMKTNLGATVATMVGDMRDSGELSDIIDNELLPDMSNRIDEAKALAQKTAIIADGFLLVDSLSGIKKCETLEEAKSAVTTNAQIIQAVIANGVKLKFGEGYYPFETQLNISPEMSITSTNGNTYLVFPSSKGIVTASAGYFHSIKINGVNIHSDGHCIDFVNDGVNYPNNVYWSEFKDMWLKSENGTCVYAGDVKGVGGDKLVFNCTFRRMHVCAPNGDGFHGVGGLGIIFEDICDYEAIKNVFRNCKGTWLNVNTTFAGAERFLYIDNNAIDDYGSNIILRNVNIEDVTKGAIYVENTHFAHSHVIFENVSVYIRPSGSEKINIHPFHLGLFAQRIEAPYLSIHFNGGATWESTYTMPKSDMSFSELLRDDRCICDNVTIHRRVDNSVFTYNETTYTKSASFGENYNKYYKHVPEMQIDYIHGVRGQIAKEIDVSTLTDHTVILKGGEHFDGLILKNATAKTYINFIQLRPHNFNDDGRSFYIRNASGYPVELMKDYGAYHFKFKDLADGETKKTLPNNSVMTFTYFHDSANNHHYFVETASLNF